MTGGLACAEQKDFRHDSAGPSHGYVLLKLIPGDIERTVENAQDIDISIVLDQIGDAVVAV